MGTQGQFALSKEARRKIRSWVRDAAIAVALGLAIVQFVVQPVRVEGSSMEPTYRQDNRLFIDKLSPRWRPYERGEVVIVRRCNADKTDCVSFLKRIVGLPGEMVETENGCVAINRELLGEPYIDRERLGGVSTPVQRIPPNHYWVMGDNRARSNDSRYFGPVHRDSITGRVWLRYWP